MAYPPPNTSVTLASSPRTLSSYIVANAPQPVQRKPYVSHRDPRAQTTDVFTSTMGGILREFEAIQQALDIVRVCIDSNVALPDKKDAEARCEELASSSTRNRTLLRQRQELIPFLQNNIELSATFKELQMLHKLNIFNQKKLAYVKLLAAGEELLELQMQCKGWSQRCWQIVESHAPMETKVSDFAQALIEAKTFLTKQHEKALSFDRELFLRLKAIHANQLTLFQYTLRYLETPNRATLEDKIEDIRKLKNPYANYEGDIALRTTFRKLAVGGEKQIQGDKKPITDKFEQVSLDKYLQYAQGVVSPGPIVKHMQDHVVKGLVSLRKTVDDYLKDVFQGNFDPKNPEQLPRMITLYEAIFKDLESDLAKSRTQILDLKPTRETFNALEYLFFIQTLADEVRAQLDFFSSIYEGNFMKVANVFWKLVSFLTSRTVEIQRGDTSHDLQEISRLFEVAHAESTTPRFKDPQSPLELFCNSTLQTIETTIAIAGRRAIEVTDAEKFLVSKVLAKREIEAGTEEELPHDIKSWLEKGATRYHFFTRDASNPEYDLVLFNIQHVECYRHMYIRSMERDMSFRIIVNSYSHHNSIAREKEQFEIMSDIYMLLEKLEQKIPESEKQTRVILDTSWYVRLRQLLFHIRPQESERMQYLFKEADRRMKAYEAKTKLPDYAPLLQNISPPNENEAITEQIITPYLYKLIAQGLWTLVDGTRQAAVAKLVETLTRYKEEFIPQDKFLLQLLQELSLNRFYKAEKLITSEKLCLYQLMGDYAANPHTRNAFHELYTVEFLEAVLYHLMLIDNAAPQNGMAAPLSAFQQKVARSREPYLRQWQQFMKTYASFFALKSAGHASREDLVATLKEAQRLAEHHRDSAPEEYRKILLRCLKHMESALPQAL